MRHLPDLFGAARKALAERAAAELFKKAHKIENHFRWVPLVGAPLEVALRMRNACGTLLNPRLPAAPDAFLGDLDELERVYHSALPSVLALREEYRP